MVLTHAILRYERGPFTADNFGEFGNMFHLIDSPGFRA
jgi:hypothetical protein